MSLDSEGANLLQFTLFDFQKTSSEAFELFPKVWAAAEALTDLNVGNRLAGLAILEEIRAARFSPLVAYLLLSKIIDSDLNFRVQLIKAIAEVFEPDEQGNLAPEVVRQNLTLHLCQIRSHQILAILEAASVDPGLDLQVAALLKPNCEAGNQLMEILADRRMPIKLRERAAHFMVRVGYVESVPGIERLIGRLESRINGQQAFSFSSPDSNDESELLPTLKLALAALQAP